MAVIKLVDKVANAANNNEITGGIFSDLSKAFDTINPNTIKSYKIYLQNTQHMVLRNRPTLIIGTERLACLNSPPGVQRSTLA